MSLMVRKKAKFFRYIVVLSFIILIQLSHWVNCSNTFEYKSLSSRDKYELYSLSLEKRISFLELYLMKRVEGIDEAKSDIDEKYECLIKIRYYKLLELMTEGTSFDAGFERNIAIKCLKKSLIEASKFYIQFLNSKFIYKSTCLSKLCKKNHTKVLFKRLEDLAFSAYFLLSINDLIKTKGDFASYLDSPHELEHKSEIISILDIYVNLNSYEEGLDICMKYDMLNILIYPRFDKSLLLADHKVFSSIVRILTVNIWHYIDKCKYYRKYLKTCTKKDYRKKISLLSKKILSLMKLISYAVLTKLLILADIKNTEDYGSIYKFIIDNKQKGELN